jgi:hypothetical protein
MARPSPITIGLAALTAVVLATAILVIARPRREPPARAIEIATEPLPAAPAPRADPAPRPPLARAPDQAPAAPAEPVPAPTPVAAVEVAEPSVGTEPPPPPAGPSGALVKNHNLRLDEADDEAFKALNLPDATRARVRAINDEHHKRTEGDPSAVNVTSATQARRDQLRLLLGEDVARQFDAEERAAVRRLRGKYRFEWGMQTRGK